MCLMNVMVIKAKAREIFVELNLKTQFKTQRVVEYELLCMLLKAKTNGLGLNNNGK